MQTYNITQQIKHCIFVTSPISQGKFLLQQESPPRNVVRRSQKGKGKSWELISMLKNVSVEYEQEHMRCNHTDPGNFSERVTFTFESDFVSLSEGH